MTCKGKQYSDKMVCKRCNLTWDMNDPDPPACRDRSAPEPGGTARRAPPSFDEWFKAKHGGASFDAVYWQAGMMLADHVHALSREARAYLSEIAQGIHHG